MAESTDVAVVGAGIVGLSTAFALRELGRSVSVYDVGPPGAGQSAGQSRIFRHAHDDPRLVDLAVSSRAIWREWAAELDTELVSDGGAVALGPGIHEKLRILGDRPEVPAREIAPEELVERMPLLAGYEGPAMLDEAGGSIRTRAAITALADRLADSLVTDQVISLRPGRHSVEVRTGTTRSDHAHVVVCAGRGTAALARGAGLSIPVQLGAHVRATFAVRDAPHRVATLQDSSGVFGETGVYGAAYPDDRHFAVGLSGHVRVGEDGSIVDPQHLADLADQTCGYVAKALPGLDPSPVEYVHCWVTELPWGEDAVGVWQADGISFVAGHNLFKQAPALGRALAGNAVGEGLPDVLTPEARLGEAP